MTGIHFISASGGGSSVGTCLCLVALVVVGWVEDSLIERGLSCTA